MWACKNLLSLQWVGKVNSTGFDLWRSVCSRQIYFNIIIVFLLMVIGAPNSEAFERLNNQTVELKAATSTCFYGDRKVCTGNVGANLKLYFSANNTFVYFSGSSGVVIPKGKREGVSSEFGNGNLYLYKAKLHQRGSAYKVELEVSDPGGRQPKRLTYTYDFGVNNGKCSNYKFNFKVKDLGRIYKSIKVVSAKGTGCSLRKGR